MPVWGRHIDNKLNHITKSHEAKGLPKCQQMSAEEVYALLSSVLEFCAKQNND